MNRVSHYLTSFSLRLMEAATHLDPEIKVAASSWLLSHCSPDGGFVSRRGKSDIYYTGFALRSLLLIGHLDEKTAVQSGDYLLRFAQHSIAGGRSLTMAELLSLLIGDGIINLVTAGKVSLEKTIPLVQWATDELTQMEHPQGGFGVKRHAPCATVYDTFLGLICREILGVPLDEATILPIVELLDRCCRPNGGFAQMIALPEGGTNPTAAAVGTLSIIRSCMEPTRLNHRYSAERIAGFLDSMKIGGGFSAHRRIPVPDLLSTFSGTIAGFDLVDQSSLSTDFSLLEQFVDSLQREGGWCAGIWDNQPDIEYTYYGLALKAYCRQRD